MRKQLARATLVAGTVAAALCLSIPAALAAVTVTVSGGTSFTSTQTTGASFKLTDATTNQTFTCTKGSSAGTVTDGTHENNPFGSVTSNSFSSCTNGFVSGSSSQKTGTTASLNGLTYSAPVETGTITNVDETLTITGICSTEVKGTAGVTYNNNTHVLAFTTAGDSLSVQNNNCSPFVKSGDTVQFSGSGETVTGSPVNPIQVSNP